MTQPRYSILEIFFEMNSWRVWSRWFAEAGLWQTPCFGVCFCLLSGSLMPLPPIDWLSSSTYSWDLWLVDLTLESLQIYILVISALDSGAISQGSVISTTELSFGYVAPHNPTTLDLFYFSFIIHPSTSSSSPNYFSRLLWLCLQP